VIYQKVMQKKIKPLPQDLPDELLGNLKRLGDLVIKQLKEVLDSFVNKDFDKAKEVWEKDEQVDNLTYIAMESVIDFLSKDKKNLDFSTHLIFATKNLERAGDHITNIAENVCYLVKGEYLKGNRPKGRVIQE
jgi:phosphate transport system protein